VFFMRNETRLTPALFVHSRFVHLLSISHGMCLVSAGHIPLRC